MKQYYLSLFVALSLLCSLQPAWGQQPDSPTHLRIYQHNQVTEIPLDQVDSIRFELVKKTPTRPMIGIDYVAEYNVGKEAGTFATSQSNDASGYYAFDQVGTACPAGYHTPTRYEAAVLMPSFGPQYETYVMFGANKSYTDVAEAIQVGSVKASYLSDYKSIKGRKVSYALRFKKGSKEMNPDFPVATDNSLQAAYRYEVVGEHKIGSKEAYLKITVRYLGSDFTGSIEDIATEDFWAKDGQDDVVRILPSSVYYHPQKHAEIMGAGAFYWTSSPHEKQAGFVWTIAYIPQMAYISYNSTQFKFGIRPFKDAE